MEIGLLVLVLLILISLIIVLTSNNKRCKKCKCEKEPFFIDRVDGTIEYLGEICPNCEKHLNK